MSSLAGMSGRRKNPAASASPAARAPEREEPAEDTADQAGYGGQPLDDEEQAPTRRRRPQQRAPRARQPRPDSDESTDVPVSFQVSEGVRRRLDKAQSQALTSSRTRKGHLEFILEALDAGAEEGWEAVVKASVPERKASRFGGVRPLKDRDYAGTGSESLYVRMEPEMVAELDSALEEAKVPDRNKLVAMCLNRYLPGRKERPTGSGS
ncbi:hypothetical protein OG883_43045 [Streptomyces sp. NBC_01142]|uniref:hypothetical protein n=1 Tax=Streptomyces sp. NBC_01142 TaxID=2975865 RepID=UPI002259C6AA|nr:hypothetical protein [Streptomyces sp. NBC_01142]MCX4826419.1 hypothetical protein [Streptomyces sp. NBC_01142]